MASDGSSSSPSVTVNPIPKNISNSMTDYVEYFERVSKANGWSDGVQATIFPSLLEVGNRSLVGFSDTTLSSFTAMKRALLGDSEPFRESNLATLMNLSYNSKDESLTAFRERISALIEKCYSRFAAANKQQLIRDYFVHSLPKDYQKFLWSTTTTKIDEALNNALLYESMKPKNEVKDSYKGMTQSEQVQQRKYVGNAPINSNRSRNTDACFFCHKTGHYARDCLQKKSFMEGLKKPSVNAIAARYFVTLQVGQGIEEMLLDTGASISILPANRYDVTNYCNSELRVADGRIMKSTGSVTLPICSVDGNFLLDHEFYIAPVDKCYIGTDILEKLGAVVDIQKRIITTEQNVVIEMSSEAACLGRRSTVVSSVEIEDDVQYLTGDVPEDVTEPTSCVDGFKKKEMETLLESYENLFSGIGKTELVKHYIHTEDNVPVNLPSYRLPVQLKDKAKCIIEE